MCANVSQPHSSITQELVRCYMRGCAHENKRAEGREGVQEAGRMRGLLYTQKFISISHLEMQSDWSPSRKTHCVVRFFGSLTVNRASLACPPYAAVDSPARVDDDAPSPYGFTHEKGVGFRIEKYAQVRVIYQLHRAFL